MLLWPMLLIITPDAGGFGLNYHFYVYVIFVVIMCALRHLDTAPKPDPQCAYLPQTV